MKTIKCLVLGKMVSFDLKDHENGWLFMHVCNGKTGFHISQLEHVKQIAKAHGMELELTPYKDDK